MRSLFSLPWAGLLHITNNNNILVLVQLAIVGTVNNVGLIMAGSLARLEFGVLGASGVISGQVPTCDNVHSW